VGQKKCKGELIGIINLLKGGVGKHQANRERELPWADSKKGFWVGWFFFGFLHSFGREGKKKKY